MITEQQLKTHITMLEKENKDLKKKIETLEAKVINDYLDYLELAELLEETQRKYNKNQS